MSDTGMEMRARLLILGLALTGAACAGGEAAAPPGIFFATIPSQGSYPSARLEGVLQVRSGCVFISTPEIFAPEDDWLPLWPEGYAARFAEGHLEVVDDTGQLVGREGEQIRVGGGEAPSWASELADADLPDRCGDLYWIVAP